MARLIDNDFPKKSVLNNNDYLLVDNATQGSAAVSIEAFMNKHKTESHLNINISAESGVDKELYDALLSKGLDDQISNGEIDIKAIFAEIISNSNPLIELDTTAEIDTTDNNLYTNIQLLGWDNDIIDSLSNIVAKKALVKITDELRDWNELKQLDISQSVSNSMSLTRVGRICYFKMDNLLNVSSGENIVLTLPIGWRPYAQSLIAFDAPNTTTRRFRLSVTAAGVLSIYNYASGITGNTNASVACCWIAKPGE